MLKNKMKKLICGMTMCITVCSQMIFPQTAFAATKAAVEKAGEAFVAGMTETAEAEEVLSEKSFVSKSWILRCSLREILMFTVGQV